MQSIQFKCVLAAVCLFTVSSHAEIDRKALAERHNVNISKTDQNSPAQVGNGEFAFNFDITGLQTFVPFNTLSRWAWHSSPMPPFMKSTDDFMGTPFKVKGKTVYLSTPIVPNINIAEWRRDFPDFKFTKEQAEIAKWMAKNPHSLNLGRIGFEMFAEDGSPAKESDITDPQQTLNIYTGIAESSFSFKKEKVSVTTLCRQSDDTVAFEISSPLLKSGKLKVFFEFPYADDSYMAFFVGKWDMPKAHSSKLSLSENSALIERTLDGDKYFALIKWEGEAEFSGDENNAHKFRLAPKCDSIRLFVNFSKEKPAAKNFSFEESLRQSRNAWEKYWLEGAAIDFGQTADPRAAELERRMVLSQYLMRINAGGSLPPQESGLLSNSWYGKFHYEMIWWHTAHFVLWGKGDIAQRQWKIFSDRLEEAKARAKREGYKGAKWDKSSGNMPFEWPHIIHATLLWQQPHPIYFAELEYRRNPSESVLKKWSSIVFETADFLASYPCFNGQKKRYELLPPMTLVSENTNQLHTKNPTFELAYWRYGLRTALKWKERLGLEKPKEWLDVLENLAPAPVENGVYVTYEGIPQMWTKYNFEHPALIGVYGMLPGDGINVETAKATLSKVKKLWNFDRIWGWDFPMMAMSAARLGDRELAVDMLLHKSKNFRFSAHGVASGGPCPYFPSNGGLLAALAMMAGGWDGANEETFDAESLAFPKEWKVKAEGFIPYE